MSQSRQLIAKEIDDALTLELAATPKQFVYAIGEVRRIADVVVVKVRLDDSDARGLDESLEGAAAWWPGPPRGFADVLSVDPEHECVNLRFVSPQPPSVDDKLFLYPPLFLEALRNWWRIEPNAQAGIRWLENTNDRNQQDASIVLRSVDLAWLRRAQRDAFRLVSWDCGFLEGPPGTGKTTTLGAILATYLAEFPGKRVLLLSTTNTAVDLALVAVDRAIEELPRSAWNLRQQCKRLGHHFIAKNYDGRTHLLPTPNPELVKKLAELESKRPDVQDVVAYSAWKREVERLRAQLKTNLAAVMRSSRVAAMTTCGAMFWTSALHECAPFDLIVFDEASQVGLAYAMALATFGKRCLFAGDPAQLAPIVQSEHRQPRRWLGRSPFDAIPNSTDANPGPSVFLDEQSRMHAEICDVVSRLFYRGKLHVARKTDADWHRYRALQHPSSELRKHVVALTVPASSQWSQKYRGPIRYDSAKAVAALVSELLTLESPESILVLTPFRAQRTLLRSMLRQECKGVTVSTVHRAQGSERRTVIFDPVDGTSSFLLGDESRRLINVALSRAEARLILMLSESDRQNPLFQHADFGAGAGAEPVESYVRRSDFPRCLRGKRIRFKDCIGKVMEVSCGRVTIESDNGAVLTYSADFLKAMLAKK